MEWIDTLQPDDQAFISVRLNQSIRGAKVSKLYGKKTDHSMVFYPDLQ